MHTHIYFLLDRTGSMNPMVDDVVGGFNTFLAEQRAEGDDARMTLVQFDSQDPFEVIADAVRLAKVPELTAAALELFVEKGFAATRLDDIAALVGRSFHLVVIADLLQVIGAADRDGREGGIRVCCWRRRC